MRQKHLFISLVLFVFKHPKILLIALLLGGLGYTYELFYARDTMVFGGVPKSNEHFVRVFRNQAYMVGYSDSKGNPLWVVYKLTSPKPNTTALKRPENFSADWRNFYFIQPNDYTNSGYDRGHMAPNHAISVLYGKEAQIETFLMTNISPQKPSLNQKLWQTLEEKELYEFTQNSKELWVFTGPLFDKKSSYLKHSKAVEIPDAFYKFYVKILEDGTIKTAGFILPQTVKPYEKLSKFAVSIDEIEARSGFDFLHVIQDHLENELEANIDVTDWLDAM